MKLVIVAAVLPVNENTTSTFGNVTARINAVIPIKNVPATTRRVSDVNIYLICEGGLESTICFALCLQNIAFLRRSIKSKNKLSNETLHG